MNLKKVLGDDSVQNWTVFDTFAPTVATWHYGEFDEMAYAQMELWDLMDMFISHFLRMSSQQVAFLLLFRRTAIRSNLQMSLKLPSRMVGR